VLVLLMGVTYEIHSSDGFKCRDIVIKFREDWMDIQIILRLLPEQFKRLQCWCYLWEGFMTYAVEMVAGGVKCMQSFMMISLGIQVILSLILL
jgi:hypothetical protein